MAFAPDPLAIAFLLLCGILSLMFESFKLQEQRAQHILQVLAIALTYPLGVYIWVALFHPEVQELSPWARWGYAIIGIVLTTYCLWDHYFAHLFNAYRLRKINRHG